MTGEKVTEEQALGLSDVAHGGDIGFIHSRTWRTLRSKGLVFQRGDGSMGLTDKGHDALSEAVRRWPVLLDRTPTPERSEVAETTAGERCLREHLLSDEGPCPIHRPAEPDAGERPGVYGTGADYSVSRHDADVDALIRVLRGEATHLDMARAVLASDWLAARDDRVRRGEGAKVLREAADDFNLGALSFKEGGWGSNPADQQAISVMATTLKWLRDRAASVGRGADGS